MEKDVKDLKKLKPGDQIILLKSRNNMVQYEGKTFTIVSVVSGGNYQVSSGNGAIFTVYSTNPCDTFCLADRKEHAKYLRNQVEEKKEEIRKILKEIDFLEKYETEEDFVADKLMAVINAKDKSGIVKILKEMKASNMI